MKMRDKNLVEIQEGNEVHFGLNRYHWDGKVLEVDNASEEVLILVTKRSTGEGMIERMNYASCSNYIEVTNI